MNEQDMFEMLQELYKISEAQYEQRAARSRFGGPMNSIQKREKALRKALWKYNQAYMRPLIDKYVDEGMNLGYAASLAANDWLNLIELN